MKFCRKAIWSIVLVLSIICSSTSVMAGTDSDSTASPEEMTFRTSQVTNIKVTKQSVYSITIGWSSLKYAENYMVYRASTEYGEYENLGTIDSKTYADEEVSPGKTYYYKVIGSALFDGDPTYSQSSAIIKAVAKPSKVSFTAVANSSGIDIAVNRIAGVTGYAVYSSNSENGEYNRITTLKQQDNITYKMTGLNKGTTYYIKVRAYKKLTSGKVYWGAYSTIKSVAFGDSNKLILSKDNIENYKRVEADVIQVCLDNDFWDPNYEREYKIYELKSISFIDCNFDGWLDLVVRSSYINSDTVSHIKVFYAYHEGFGQPPMFEATDDYDDGVNLSIKAYKDKNNTQFFLANVKYDSSGASGQIGTRVNLYYTMDTSNGVLWEKLMGASYTLNYHKVVDYDSSFIFQGKSVSESQYEKSQKAYLAELTALSFKETVVPYNSSMSESEKRTVLKKAYEAFYK